MTRFAWMCRKQSSLVLLVVALVSLTGVLGNRFYNQPKLNVGTIAPQTIKAPDTAAIEDVKATAAKRQKVRNFSVSVLMIDFTANQQIHQDLQQVLERLNKIRLTSGNFPFTETLTLSISTQLYLRECSQSEWQVLLGIVKARTKKMPPAMGNVALTQAVAELQAYRLTTSWQNFSALLANIAQVRRSYTKALAMPINLAAPTLSNPALLSLTDADWEKAQNGIKNSAQRILAQGISPGLPQPILREAVSLQVHLLVPTLAEPLATEVLLNVLQPNLKEDAEQTKQQVEKAAAAVEPAIIEIQRGEVIVQAGKIITQYDFVLLDHFQLSRREINWLGLLGLSGIVSGAVGFFGILERRFTKLRQSDRLLVLLLSLSTPMLLEVVDYANLPAVGLLLGSFYGSALGVTVIGLLSVVLHISMEIGWQQLLIGAIGGVLGSKMVAQARSREEMALVGGGVGLTQGVVYLVVNLIFNATTGSWYILLQQAALVTLSGLVWSIVALGLSPYLEQVFDLVTPSRLAELANPNRPLLKRLATVAPGTFQHTLFVATLAEAAAKALGCNVELIRAGTLYHDIGKMEDPLAFIENQMSVSNKHDQINDPWKSAKIIKNHVSAGLVMARKCRLPSAIQAFIPEHQGTMLIAYFYYQAQQLVQLDPSYSLQESDFRYDGPIPQSRETGIVSLADSCEAALRSLKDAGREEALAMVNKILRARWQDQQLVDSGLTRQEIAQIADIFVQVWEQFHHKRIAYPRTVLN